MADIGLTQEQIDALLGSGGTAPTSTPAPDSDASTGSSLLPPSDFRLLEDFEHQAMGNLPSVINAMTGFENALQRVEISEAVGGELPSLLGDCLLFSLPLTIDESLTHYIAVELVLARRVAAALTGGGDDSGQIGEMEMSAISEVVSQINGSYLTNLSATLGMPAHGESTTLGDVATLATEAAGPLVIAYLQIAEPNGEPSTVWHLMPMALAKKVIAKVGAKTHVAPAPPPPKPAPQAQPQPIAAPQPVPPAPAAQPIPQPVMANAGPSMYGATAAVVGSAVMAPPAVEYASASFQQLMPPSLSEHEQHNLDLLLDVPLQITVELGKTSLPVKQILEYGQGSLITLDKLAGEPIDLLVNGKPFAKGEVVVIEENFGVRITSILSPAERLGQLG